MWKVIPVSPRQILIPKMTLVVFRQKLRVQAANKIATMSMAWRLQNVTGALSSSNLKRVLCFRNTSAVLYMHGSRVYLLGLKYSQPIAAPSCHELSGSHPVCCRLTTLVTPRTQRSPEPMRISNHRQSCSPRTGETPMGIHDNMVIDLPLSRSGG